jgi:hypothetical protein
MESVRLAISQTPGDTAHRNLRGSVTSTADLPGASWVKFGDAIAYYGNASDWPHVSEAAGRASLSLRDHPHEIDPKHLHVVIQKGNLFQRKYPEIPIILDKGRFLLVEMHAEQAQRLSGAPPCYSIHPLEAMAAADPRGKNRIVFTAHNGPAIRASARAADPAVRELVSGLSRTTFEADLTKLAQFPTRNSITTHFKDACNFAKEQFATMGYATRLQDIAVNGASSANVVSERVGAGAQPRRLVLVTAHLDSINGHAGGDSAAVAPGADDDGSGSAGVLEIARALKDHHGKNDLQFVLFGGEEEGLLGSDEFVRSMNATDRARVQAVVQMDMIGSLNTAIDTRALQAYLGHRNIQHTVRYTELSPTRFKNFWRSVKGLSVVNGCQSISTIYTVSERVRSPEAKDARILFRVYEIPDRALADRISINTNSQTAHTLGIRGPGFACGTGGLGKRLHADFHQFAEQRRARRTSKIKWRPLP